MTAAAVAFLQPVIDVVERRLGLRCEGARTAIVIEVIRAAMRSTGYHSPQDFARHLACDAGAADEIAEQLRVPETYFLREPVQLRVLVEQVLPALATHRGTRDIRIWSAGCASGEEAYSLAIACERAGLGDRVRMLATDRSPVAIAAAERGVYRARSLRSVTAAERERYFTAHAEATGFVVADRLRRGVTFRQHDLVADAPPGDQDLIVCRNVLLYLTQEHGAAVVERLARSLAPGGWLVLGSADLHHQAASLLERVRGPSGSLYRRPGGSTERQDRRRPPDRRSQPAWPRDSPTARRRLPAPSSVPSSDESDLSPLHRCEREVAERPLDAGLHVRHATLLLEAGRAIEARRAATAALFLDPDLAAAHLVLGRAELASGAPVSAARSFRNAQRLLAALPAHASVPASAVAAGRLAAVADAGRRQAERRYAS